MEVKYEIMMWILNFSKFILYTSCLHMTRMWNGSQPKNVMPWFYLYTIWLEKVNLNNLMKLRHNRRYDIITFLDVKVCLLTAKQHKAEQVWNCTSYPLPSVWDPNHLAIWFSFLSPCKTLHVKKKIELSCEWQTHFSYT